MPNRPLIQIIMVIAGAFSLFSTATVKAQTLSEFRAQYLAAESFEETKMRVDPANLKSIFYQILRDVIRDDPDNAANIVLHTNKLILRNIQERGSFKPVKSGGSYIQSFLSYYEDVIETLDCVGVLVRTYREDIKGQIPYTGLGNNAQKFALYSHFLNLGGNYDTSGAMDRMLSDLRISCGEGNSIFLAPYFFDFAYNLRPHQRDELANWAILQSNDPDLTVSGFGGAIHLGLALFEHTEGVSVNCRELMRGVELDSKLIEVLRDTRLSPAWRAGFTSLMGRNFRDKLSPALRVEIGNVLTRALLKQVSFPGTAFRYSIAAFLRGEEDDSGWRSQGVELVNAWEKRASKTLLPASQRLEPNGDWIVPMTELICRVGTKEQLSIHFRRFCFDDLVYPGIWINLIKTENFSLANQARLKQGLLTEFSPDHYKIDTGYDERLAKATPAYLKTISAEKDRTITELLIAAVPDPEIPLSENLPSDRQSRLKEFVEQFKEMPDWSDNYEVRALEVLSISQKNPVARKWIESRQIGLEERIEQDEPQVRPYWAGRIEMHSAAEELEDGSQFPIELWWGRAVKDDNQIISRRRGDLCRAILMMMDERIASACKARDIERLRKFLPVSRGILESIPEYVYRSYVRHFTIRSVAAHSLCGESAEWSKWWQALDPVRKRHLVSVLTHSGELIPVVSEVLNPNKRDPREAFQSAKKRREIIKGILETAWVNDSYDGYSNLANAAAVNLLDTRDLYEIAGGLARESPRKGSSWREYFGILSDTDQLEEALRIADEEIEKS
ncbi:MAG: hypothetical protein P1V20_30805, partial [Verrucomicrobiales bacterium]|nr:hypothetical protein [Verrucomicrobiales bacterium]